MIPTVKISIAFHGSFEPAEITAALGLQPTETWRHGDRKQVGRHTLPARKQDGWALRLPPAETNDVAPLVKQVLALFNGKEAQVASLRHLDPQIYGELQCVIYRKEPEMPWLHLDSAMIRSLNSLSIEFDLDVYLTG